MIAYTQEASKGVEIVSTTSERLIKCRGEKSQAQVAKEAGLSQSAIAMYERGERVPRDEYKRVLAKIYNTTVQELFF